MNWISNVVRPKIRSFLRRETPENLWIKCPETGQLVFYKDVEANQFVIPSSNYHMRISAPARPSRFLNCVKDVSIEEYLAGNIRLSFFGRLFSIESSRLEISYSPVR